MKKGRPGDIAESDLHAYADGSLPAAKMSSVEAHLAQSPEDSARVAEWRQQASLLRGAFDPVLTESVPLRLSPFRLASRRATARARPRLIAIALLAFAAGLGSGALIMLGVLSLDRSPVTATLSGAEALASRALAAHRTFTAEVRHPVEVAASEEAHLVQWLSKRLDYKIQVPDLRSEGFSLLGGRLLSTDNGPAALLMFENAKGERLTLFCTKGGGPETSFRYVQHAGSAAFYWVDAHAAYALSGPADRERLLRIAKRVYEALERPGRDS
jgi:anti-sigma factor RsiW